MKENKKECLHNWTSVYYGSEWGVECSKCEKNVFYVYPNKEACKIINEVKK